MMKTPFKRKFKIMLAPMAGYTDKAFRGLCSKQGCDITLSEMVSVEGILHNDKTSFKLMEKGNKEKCYGIQLFGRLDSDFSEAISYIQEKKLCDFIDINMGCPAGKVLKQRAGAYLLKEVGGILPFLKKIRRVCKIPLTVKIRSDYDFLSIAKICDESKIDMITVHPRTIKQGFSGKADWGIIKMIKESVKIPVCGNGDIRTARDAQKMFEETGCDHVMIGRGALSNPFIFKEIKAMMEGKEIRIRQKGEVLDLFFEYLKLAKKENIPFSSMKLHSFNFISGLPGSARSRERITLCKNAIDLRKIIDSIKNS
jgi:tRNA-dihydrouridine synthase B